MLALFSTLLASALTASAVGLQLSLPNTLPSLAACINEPLQFSCENTTEIKNTCCSPTPGGLVLQTQFWDTYTGLEKQGQLLPKGSWGIHGLWPDFCDGCVETSLFLTCNELKLCNCIYAGALHNTVTRRGSLTRLHHQILPMVCQMAPSYLRTKDLVLTLSSSSLVA